MTARTRKRSKRTGTGSFYTRPAAATLLASMALSGWREHGPVPARPPRVIDPSCGDGALLLAARRLCPEAELYGLDINAEAIARARERVPDGRFLVMPYGLDEHGIFRLGTLELLACWPPAGPLHQSFDIVLTNPPYTRADLQGAHLSPAERKAMQARMKEIRLALGEGVRDLFPLPAEALVEDWLAREDDSA